VPFYRGKPNFWGWTPARLAPDFAAMARGLGLLCPLWEGGGNAVNLIDGVSLTAQSGTSFAAGGPGLVSSRSAIDAHYARATYQPFAGADLTIMGVANPVGTAASDGNGSLFSQRVGAAGSFAQVGLLLNFDSGGGELDGSISLIGLNGGGASFGVAATGQMDGEYHIFAGTYTQSSGALAMYRDGASVASTTGSSGLLTSYTNQDVSIGGLGQITGNATYGLKRQIAWVAVWNRVLSAAEIQAAAANWNGLIEPSGLPVYLRVAQAAGSGALTGTSAATSGATATLTGTGALTGTSAVTSGLSGSMLALARATASSDALSGTTGSLTGAGALSATSAATSGLTGPMLALARATGTSDAVSGATGALTGAGALSGTSAVTSGLTGALTGAGALSGTSAATSGLTGSMLALARATATSTVTSGATGNLAGRGALSATADVLSGTTGSLTGRGALSATSAATSGLTGTLSNRLALLVGTSDALSGMTGNLAGRGSLTGTIAAASVVSARLRDTSLGAWDAATASTDASWAASGAASGIWTAIPPASSSWSSS
jgi:hypothetical protein